MNDNPARSKQAAAIAMQQEFAGTRQPMPAARHCPGRWRIRCFHPGQL
jgi:hypothetical protein